MVIWVRTLGSKEIRLGSQVRKQEQANILKWGFLFVVSPIPTWNPEWCHRCLVPSLLFSWMLQSFRLVSQQCFQNILLGTKGKQIWIRLKRNIPELDQEKENEKKLSSLVLYLTKFFPIKLRENLLSLFIQRKNKNICKDKICI